MTTSKNKIIPVVLCGGSGTRLWPLSREKSPKQFHPIVNDQSLLHATLDRAINCAEGSASEIIVVTTDSLQKETIHQLADYDPKTISHILSEPIAKNTAAAICYAALYANKHFGPNSILWILPADHHISDIKGLSEAVHNAAEISADGHIATFGMQPFRPDTGYGYIKTGETLEKFGRAQKISQFVEKPDKETAQKYLEQGNFLWNSGMFVGTTFTILDNFIEYCPDIIGPMHQEFSAKSLVSIDTYKNLPELPFDIAIMEKTQKAAVLPCNIGWSDVGSWESVWDVKEKDTNGNVTCGKVTTVDTTDSIIQSNALLIAAIGLKDIVVVEHGDSILVADKKSSSSMKALINGLKEIEAEETIYPPIENRPWGRFKVLSKSNGYKVKELTVKPGQKLSLQMHNHRCEFWTVISGEAVVTINNETKILKEKEGAFVPLKATHRLENSGSKDLVMIEVQCGDYLGEDDIVRFDDIYGRTEAA